MVVILDLCSQFNRKKCNVGYLTLVPLVSYGGGRSALNTNNPCEKLISVTKIKDPTIQIGQPYFALNELELRMLLQIIKLSNV